MRVFDALIRVAGGVLAVAMAVGLAVLEAFATPWPWPIPVAAALVGNIFLAWFAVSTVERWWAWLLPAVPWILIMLVAIAPTSEGDLPANSWTGLGTFAAGAIGFFVPSTRRRSDHKMGILH